ncbi:MAG TPA: hypothetical protein VJV78_23890 [Polyangiales bacterium]|nr:hypothetical protein [Polyangiales bacterium]
MVESEPLRGRGGQRRLQLIAAGVCWLLAAARLGAEPASISRASVLKNAAFRTPAGAPSVIVHAPPGWNPRAPLHLVVFLHGYNGCVNVLMAEGPSHCKPGAPERDGWDLGTVHDAAGTNTLFVVPQLAFAQRNGDPGAFGTAGGFRAFLEELLRDGLGKQLGGARRIKDVASLTLVAHSGAYQAALAIAEQGGVRSQLKAIVLLDALYGETDRYAELVENWRGLRFVSLYLERGTPRTESQRLYERLSRSIGGDKVLRAPSNELARAVVAHPIVFGLGRPPHRLLPQTHLAELLRAFGQLYLPKR